jgi:hypothetical protein
MYAPTNHLLQAQSGVEAAEAWNFDVKKVSISVAMFYGSVLNTKR